MFDRARTKAVADCKTASAPGVWRGAETETGIWTATVSNESGASLVVSCDVSGIRPPAPALSCSAPSPASATGGPARARCR